MSRPLGMLLFLSMLAPLAGCYQSTAPLIAADDAVFPFTRLTYEVDDVKERYTLVREGDEYVDPDDGNAPRVRFREIGPDLYLAQGHFVIEQASFYAYAMVKGALDKPAIELHAGFADESGPPPDKLPEFGFAECDHLEGMVCFEEIDPYLDYAVQRIEAGEKPDRRFTLISHE